ncbi:MAG: PAC2 family protein, partial [Candidatus Heimdallarchaeota archaeon]|nr:PAC2 family protein [Candidatus Heimdallarchaeota archaeon]
MDFVTIRRIKKVPKLTQPLLIEGLPGIGNVGKLAVEHLIDSIKATKFAEFYCKDFPPQVF